MIRSALVTSGTRIGAAVARELAGAGFDVAVAFNRSRDEAEACAADVRRLGRHGVALQADLARAEGCARLVDAAAAALNGLGVVVNTASRYVRTPFDEIDGDGWTAALAVDLHAAWHCCRAAVPHMRKGGGGRIVNFTDWVAASGRPRYEGYLPYYVAKRAVIGLTEALALELAKDGILVNAIAPGPIMPPPGTTDAEIASVERATPLGRWGGGDAVARAVRFLVETEFVTGEVLRVDGGRHVK